MDNSLKTFKNTAIKSKKKKLFNKKPKIFIKSKFQKRYQLFSDFRYVSSNFKFSKIKFYKKRIRVLKKYYSFYTGLNTKLFNNIIKDSLKKNDFLIERRLDIFLCRNFGGSLVQKRQEILEGKIIVNNSIKSGNYLLQNNDFIYWLCLSPWKLKKLRKTFATKKHLRTVLCLKKLPGLFFLKNPSWDLAVKRYIWKPVIRTKNKWQLRIRRDLIKKFWNNKNIQVFLYKKKI